MKNLIYLISSVILLSVLLYSCQNESDLISTKTQFGILHNTQTFDLNSQNGINSYIKASLDNQSINISESNFIESEDELGKFYLIKARYIEEGRPITAAIYLSESKELESHTRKSGLTMLKFGCTMKCTPDSNCSECQHDIIVRCQSHTCGCTAGTGGCEASIEFDDEQ